MENEIAIAVSTSENNLAEVKDYSIIYRLYSSTNKNVHIFYSWAGCDLWRVTRQGHCVLLKDALTEKPSANRTVRSVGIYCQPSMCVCESCVSSICAIVFFKWHTHTCTMWRTGLTSAHIQNSDRCVFSVAAPGFRVLRVWRSICIRCSDEKN